MITFGTMKAIVFSAGLGTRLQHLTLDCPKALVRVNGKPLLWYAIKKLTDAGVTQIVVNTHHFSQQISDYINKTDFPVPVLISDESDQLLDTGGGLKKAGKLLQGKAPIIGYNVDVISTVNLNEVLNDHSKNHSLATLVVRRRETNRYLMFDENMQLAGWKNTANGDHIITGDQFEHAQAYAFSGIQVVSPEIFDHITEEGKFPIVQLYLRLSKSQKIMGFHDHSDFWLDAGKPEHLPLAENFFRNL
jgi:NDP-sugar pyrophosphorylase family protein